MTCARCGHPLGDKRDIVDLQVILDPEVRYHFHSKCANEFILKYQEMILAIHYDLPVN